MEWVFDDGGRAEAGFKGATSDCVCRAIAIAAQMPYKVVYDLINEYGKKERTGKRKKTKSSARTGVYTSTVHKIMADLGWEWHPTMRIGSGCTVHLSENELPSGRLVVRVAHHECAVINGVIHDTFDPNDRPVVTDGYGNLLSSEARCVYGYYTKKGE